MVRLGWIRSRRSAVRCMAESWCQAGRGTYRSRPGVATGGRRSPAIARARARSLNSAMLFYEPLFLFVFFPTFYLAYLAGERRAALRLGLILGASILFYAWSEPLFVPVVLASALADHLFARK